MNTTMDKKLNSSLFIKQQPHLKKKNVNEIDRIHYVFDQRNSFCPANVPIKYGFQIRSLIENNHLPSWRFSKQDKNQMIYNPLIKQNSSDKMNPPFTFSSSTSTIQHCPRSIDSQIQHRWINLLLNSGQSKGQDRQLSSVVHQSSHPSSIPTTIISHKALRNELLLPKKCSDKQQIQQQSKIKRRARCMTFEEHLQRYYLPKWCSTYTTEFQHQKIKP